MYTHIHTHIYIFRQISICIYISSYADVYANSSKSTIPAAAELSLLRRCAVSSRIGTHMGTHRGIYMSALGDALGDAHGVLIGVLSGLVSPRAGVGTPCAPVVVALHGRRTPSLPLHRCRHAFQERVML